MSIKQEIEILSEGYDIIDNKKVFNQKKYFHYTSVDNFKTIAKELANGGGLKGSYYPANTYSWGKNKKDDEDNNLEVCLVRSDRSPDHNPGFNLSGNIGDIKFSFNEDKLQNKFGKAIPIQELPIQDKKFLIQDLNKLKKEISSLDTPKIDNLIKRTDNIVSLKKEEADKFKSIVKNTIPRFMNTVKEDRVNKIIKSIEEDINNLVKGRKPEHMESRIKLNKKDRITLDLIDKIYLPDYLNKSILDDISENVKKKIVWYKAENPREKFNY